MNVDIAIEVAVEDHFAALDVQLDGIGAAGDPHVPIDLQDADAAFRELAPAGRANDVSEDLHNQVGRDLDAYLGVADHFYGCRFRCSEVLGL